MEVGKLYRRVSCKQMPLVLARIQDLLKAPLSYTAEMHSVKAVCTDSTVYPCFPFFLPGKVFRHDITILYVCALEVHVDPNDKLAKVTQCQLEKKIGILR